MSLRSRRRAIGAVFVLGLVAALVAGFDPFALVDADGARNFGELAGGLLSPDLSSDFLARIARLAWESLLIGVLGTALASLFALVFAFFATRHVELSDPPGQVSTPLASTVRALARAVLAVARSVPEIVWAFLFVRIFGLGPGAAVFAIALTFGGIIGKLYAELAEGVDKSSPRALRAAGAGRLAVFVYGVVPQVRRQWVGYALFRLECAVRSASVLGVVGAGGLGAEIALSVRYFQYDKLATTLIAILLFITALEVASWFLRRAPARVAAILFGVGALIAVATLPIPWSALVSSESLTQTTLFFGDMLSPNLEAAFIVHCLWLVVQTVCTALVATLGAVIIAIAVAPITATSFWRGTLESPPGKRRARPMSLLISLSFRVVMQVLRAVPDLVWALLFVVWVGPGVTAGVLALWVHTTGVLGRLFSDVFEEAVPSGPRAIEVAGSSRLARYVYGLLPQTMSRLLAFSLFRFEVNVRAAAMIGFVGAGGLGDALHAAISLFHASDLATLLLVLIGTVVVIDLVGDRIRHRLSPH